MSANDGQPQSEPAAAAARSPLHVNTLAESMAILLVMAVSQRMIGFVRGMLFVRWLEPDQLGQWDLTQGFLILAAPLAVLGLPGCFGRYLEYFRQRGQLRAMLRRSGTVCVASGAVALAALVLGRHWFAYTAFGDETRVRMAMMALLTLSTVIAFNFFNEVLTGLRMIGAVSRLQFLNTIGFAGFSLALLTFWESKAEAVVLGYALACVLSCGGMLIFLRRAWRQMPADHAPLGRSELWAKIVPFAGWMWLTNLSFNMFDVADRYMVVHHASTDPAVALAQIGYYHSSRVIPILMVQVAYSLGAILTPHFSHAWEAGKREEVGRRINTAVKSYGLLAFAGATSLLWFSPILFGVIFKGKYEGGAAVFPLTLNYCAWLSLGTLLQTYLWCAERAWLSCLAMFSGVLLNVALNFWLLPIYGLHGAVFATTAANLLALTLTVLACRAMGLRFDRATLVVLLLPASLSLGPVAAGIVLLSVVAELLVGARFFDPAEKQIMRAAFERFVGRFARRLLPSMAPGVGQGLP